MANVGNIDSNVGNFFPRQLVLDAENTDLNYPFDKLYETLCNKYRLKEMTLDDFREFRKVLGHKRISILEEYIDIIFYFLLFSNEELNRKLQYFDEKFDCHSLEVRIKKTEVNEETGKTKEKYVFSKKEPNFSDIITVAGAIHSQLTGVFSPIIDMCFIDEEHLTPQEKLSLCDDILENDLETTSIIIDMILDRFEEKYQPFKNVIELENYYNFQKKRLVDCARQKIILKKKKIQEELNQSYRGYSFQRWYEHDAIAHKRGGKKFGAWYTE